MSNVTFRCGHCNNLMAVPPTSVGQQVRCPHCQQVVQVPAAAPSPVAATPAPEPAPTPPAPASVNDWVNSLPSPFEIGGGGEHESIFSEKKDTDDLFADEPGPQVELPPAEPEPQPAVPNLELAPAPTSPAPQLDLAPVVVEAELPQAVEHVEPVQLTAVEPQPDHPPASDFGADWHASPAAVHEAPAEEALPAPTVRRRASSGLYIPLLIVPLVSYAVLATILLLIVYKENRRLKYDNPHPLEFVPDIEGDNPGAKTNGGRSQFEMPDPEQTLPASLKLALGEKRTFGTIEVTPLRVKQERVTVETRGFQSEVEENPSLCLYLKIRNVSDNQTFAPMDEYFTRRSPSLDSRLNQVDPYTFLEIAGKKLFGGPAEYGRRRGDRLESVAGTDYRKVLKPGEEMTTFVCTDPRKHNVAKLLQANKGGEMLWRVQVRRGLVEFESPYKGKRTVPATTVIGVTFKEADIGRM